MHSLNALAWRNLWQGRTRTVLSALAVALGVAMTVAADIASTSILNSISESKDAQTLMAGLLDQLDRMLILIGVMITAAAGFLVFNAFAMSITQRRQQIGALRALGTARRQVMRLILIEALSTGGLGTLAGLAVGPLMGRGTIALMDATLGEGVFVFTASGASLSSLLLAAALGMGITLLSVLIPARQATYISPLDALRDPVQVGRIGTSSYIGRTLAGGLGIIGLAICLAVAPPGEWAQPPWDVNLTVLFAALWLGCLALVSPAIIGGVGHGLRGLLTRLWGATGRLIADNLRRARGRVALTILTLAVALTMIVSVTGFIRFMFNELMRPKIERTTELGAWLVSSMDFMAGMAGYSHMSSLGLPPDVIAQVRETLEGRAQTMTWRFVTLPELSFWGNSYFSFVMTPQEIQQVGDVFFTFTEGNWATAMSIMEAGCGVLVSPKVASRNTVSLGETFEVTGADGPLECTVAGIGSPYVGASIISHAATESIGSTEPIGLLVWPMPGVSRDAIAADLAALVERHPDAEFGELGNLAELQIGVMDVLPTMLNALLLLAIVAAALGVVNTTVMSVVERRRELGLLRAVGATRRQVSAVVSGEAALMGLIGGGLGLMAGAGITVILAVTYGGNAWGIPDLPLWPAAWRSVQPASLNGLVGLFSAPFICATAAWLPVRAILRGAAIETLQVERQ